MTIKIAIKNKFRFYTNKVKRLLSFFARIFRLVMGQVAWRVIKKNIKQLLRISPLKFVPPPNDNKIRLNLGCGDKILPGYINVDCTISRKGNVVNVISDLRSLAFEKNIVDEILAVHVIEHFYLWEADILLKSWREHLKSSGLIILECPNIHTAAKRLAKNPKKLSLAEPTDIKDGQYAMWPLYGDPGWQDPLMCHRWGYTPWSLIKLLKDCGFKNVRQEKAVFKHQDPRDMRIVAEK